MSDNTVSAIGAGNGKNRARVFKNYQINLGVPFQVRVPLDEVYGGHLPDGDMDGFSGRPDGADGFDGDGFAEAGFPAGGDGAGGTGAGGAAKGRPADDEHFINYEGIDINLEFDEDDFTRGRGYTAGGGRRRADAGNGGERRSGADRRGGAERRADALERARGEAEVILGTARAEAAEIVTSAEEESARIIDAARREAAEAADTAAKTMARAKTEAAALLEKTKRDGAEEGRAEGHAEYEALIAEATAIRDGAWAEYGELIEGAEGDALELVLDVARKVVGDEFVYNRQNLLLLIQDAFRHCTNKERVTLKVATDDYDYILANRDVLLSMVEGMGKLEIKRDMSLESGACLVETPFGNIDAGINTRLDAIEDAFRKVLSGKKKQTDDELRGIA